MRSGRLRNKVRIVKREETKDDYGERSHTLELVATLKVDLKEDRSSNEETNERTIDFVSKYEVHARYNTLIKNSMYMEIAGQYHRISGVVHDFRKKRFTKFIAVAVEGIE